MKTVEKMLEATWNAVNDLQDAKTHGDFKRTTQQTLDTHQQEINALKSKGEKSILESQQAWNSKISLVKEQEEIVLAITKGGWQKSLYLSITSFSTQEISWQTLNQHWLHNNFLRPSSKLALKYLFLLT